MFFVVVEFVIDRGVGIREFGVEVVSVKGFFVRYLEEGFKGFIGYEFYSIFGFVVIYM